MLPKSCNNLGRLLVKRSNAENGWKETRHTNCIDEHGKSPESCNCVCKMLLGIVQFLDVTANLLHHDLALLCLAPDFIDFAKELLNL